MNQEILDEITNRDYSVIKERIQRTVQEKITEIGSKGVILVLVEESILQLLPIYLKMSKHQMH